MSQNVLGCRSIAEQQFFAVAMSGEEYACNIYDTLQLNGNHAQKVN